MNTPGRPTPSLYLASGSPRRVELLAAMGLQALVLPQPIDETWHQDEPADHYVLRLALEKAASCLQDPACKLPLPVLAADTAVVCAGKVLGKPGSLQEASEMLGQLSGRRHQVLTAVAAGNHSGLATELVSTLVDFRIIEPDEIEAYWQSGEPCDKAGAYAIQGLGAMFVRRIEGSYSGVVGLPLFETMALLARFGLDSRQVLKGGVDEC